MPQFHFLRGLGGHFEIGRVLLASSGVTAVFTPIVFKAGDLIANGWHFGPEEVRAWCMFYPTSLGVLTSLGVFGIGKSEKDKATAVATRAATENGGMTP